MLNCIVCEEETTSRLSWRNLFNADPTNDLCNNCAHSLKVLDFDGRCNDCFGIIEGSECKDCSVRRKCGLGITQNRSVYSYNEITQSLIARWKYRGDYQIAEIFKEDFRRKYSDFYHQLKDVVIVPIPLHPNRLYERAFNQAGQLANFLPGKKRDILHRTTEEKQAKKSKAERLRSKNPFRAAETINTHVVLVDDIYTTGMTIHHAATTLLKAGAKSVYSMTLVRG